MGKQRQDATSKFAPGPWDINPYVDAIDVVDARGELVAHMADRTIAPEGMPPANARLIAQAPAYAEWADSWLKRYFEGGYSLLMLGEAMEGLRAIHAEATGGTP